MCPGPPNIQASTPRSAMFHWILSPLGVPVEDIVLYIVAGAGVVTPTVRKITLENILGIVTGVHNLVLLLTPPAFLDGAFTIFIVRGRVLDRCDGLAIAEKGGIVRD